MTLTLINGVPATTDVTQARLFDTQLDARTAITTNNPLWAVVQMLEVLPWADQWIIRCRPGARTVGKYVAEITVEDCRQPRSV